MTSLKGIPTPQFFWGISIYARSLYVSFLSPSSKIGLNCGMVNDTEPLSCLNEVCDLQR